jgi:hypothetical protein
MGFRKKVKSLCAALQVETEKSANLFFPFQTPNLQSFKLTACLETVEQHQTHIMKPEGTWHLVAFVNQIVEFIIGCQASNLRVLATKSVLFSLAST